MNTLDVSIIIVNYNTKELTRNCLCSVFEQTKDIRFEVIVSDNGSSDGSVEMIREEFPQVILLENGKNLGFGRANNRGLKIARGKYVFYLNSDTVLLNNAVKLFFDYWESSPEKDRIGALGCNLVDTAGNVIHSYGPFPSYKREIIALLYSLAAIFFNELMQFLGFKQIHVMKKNKTERITGEVDYITGADLFVKNDRYAVFDERFFMYYEESDLEYQMYQNYKKRLLIDGPVIIHFGGASSVVKREGTERYVSFSAQQSALSRLKWLKKNQYSKIGLAIVCWLNCLCFSIGSLRKKTVEIRKALRAEVKIV